MATVKEVINALLPRFTNRGDFDTLVTFAVERSLDQISTAGDLTADIRRVVVVAKNEGWLYKLLAEAAEQRPNDAVITGLRDSLAPLSADLADPWRAFVVNGQPLVDRYPTRDAVKDLDDDKSRILVVFGKPTTGKTHIANLIVWRAAEQADRIVSIDLAELWGRASTAQRRLTPRDLAERFCDQLKIDYGIIPPNDEQDSRWAIVFCDRLQGQISGAARCWVVIDEFNKVPVSQQVADLIKEFARRVSTALPNVRLVLLGFADTLPTNVEPGVLREELPYLLEADIKDFFADLYTSIGRGDDAQGIAESVAKVRPRLDPTDAVAIRALGVALAQEARDVRKKKKTDE